MTSIQRREFIKLTGKAISFCFFPSQLITISNYNKMTSINTYDVIIVGGSYSGLAAAMSLGRALKNTLIIDEGKPCNRQTPYSHNFLTNDGKTPAEIIDIANRQVTNYDTVQFFNGKATIANKTETGFSVQVASGEEFISKKLIFATGITDLLPTIEGISECWGISVLHCPYCHGYEIENEATGILGNGESGFGFAKLISNWTKDLTIFTNGPSSFSVEQIEILHSHKIPIIEKEILNFNHNNGHLKKILFKDGTEFTVKAIYAPSPFEQNCKIPESLGCELDEDGYLKIDNNYETNIKGVYAIGDNAAKMRTVANAVAMGTIAGMMISKKMIIDEF